MTGQVISMDDIKAAELVADEVIEHTTWVPLIDLFPEKAAIFLKPKSWEGRRGFFAAIVNESIERICLMGREIEKGHGRAIKDDFTIQGYLGMHEQIGHILACLGEEKPTCVNAAAVFLCSMNPDHFIAARFYFNEHGMEGAGVAPYYCPEVFEGGDPLAVFLRISVAIRPGLSDFWRRVKEGKGADKPAIN